MPQHIALLLIAMLIAATVLVQYWRQVMMAFIILTLALTGIGLVEVASSIP